MLELVLMQACLLLGGMTLLWLVSLPLRDVSIVDIAWGIAFAAAAWLALWRVGASPAGFLAASLTAVWGLRLAGYLAWRNLGKGEDRRYAKMREQVGKSFAVRSLFTVFWLQGGLVLVIGAPVTYAVLSGGEMGWVHWLAAVGVVFGVALEATADWQMARFKAQSNSAGEVMDRGLWRYSRHPNYFADAVVWWSLYGLALLAGGWWTFFGPLLMTVLLLKVSGVTLLEKDIGERRPGYRDYVRRTSAFIPWPPKDD